MGPRPVSIRHRDPAAGLDFLRVPRGGQPPTWAPQAKAAPGSDPVLLAEVAKFIWYHTIELPGAVTTPGMYDHRPLVEHYGIPAELGGKRVLDVGSFDGFWAFEFERRGASVVSMDVGAALDFDLPPAVKEQMQREGVSVPLGQAFELARRALDSNVERVRCNVYELDPSELGAFDLVHIGDLLLHVERPLEALRRIRSVASDSALICDVYQPDLEAGRRRNLVEYLGGWKDCTWWLPSLSTLAQMVIDAGFSSVEVRTTFRMAPTFDTGGYHRAVLVAAC
jgi:tRNA (mo5U34)-methyltransferase